MFFKAIGSGGGVGWEEGIIGQGPVHFTFKFLCCSILTVILIADKMKSCGKNSESTKPTNLGKKGKKGHCTCIFAGFDV